MVSEIFCTRTSNYVLIDGHKSHVNSDVVDLRIQNKIILFYLPSYTTHTIQSLDVAVFKFLKDNSIRPLLFQKNFIVTKKEFSRVVKTPFEKALSTPNVIAGFQKCSIYMFNTDVSKLKMGLSTVHK